MANSVYIVLYYCVLCTELYTSLCFKDRDLSTMEEAENELSDSELDEFFKENERLLIEENDKLMVVEQCYCGVATTSSQVIRCDNEDCSRQWFHLECVGLNEEPDAEWFCCLKCIEVSAASSATQAQKKVEDMMAVSAKIAPESSSLSASTSTDSSTKKNPGKAKVKYPVSQKIEKKDVMEAAPQYLDTALTKVENSYIFKMKTPLSLSVQDLVTQIKVHKGNAVLALFHTELVAQLWEIINPMRGKLWSEDCRQKMWQQFHALRCESTLKEQWQRVLVELSLSKEEDAEVFLLQVFAKESFGSLLNFIMEKDLPPKDQTSDDKSLNINEENALRYACGYVPHKLKKRYRRMCKNDIAAKFADVLDSWDNSEVYGDSFLNYTKEWLKLQDRGKLLKVNDDVFKFFRAVELVVRSVLYLNNMNYIQSCDIQQVLLSEMMKDERVSDRWNKIVPQLMGQLRQQLFEDVLKSYIKMRCEAFVKVYLILLKEKQSNLRNKSEKSLRKELKK